MVFCEEDLIRVRDLPHINSLYRGVSGKVVRWLHDNVYEVEVLGNTIILTSDEMRNDPDKKWVFDENTKRYVIKRITGGD